MASCQKKRKIDIWWSFGNMINKHKNKQQCNFCGKILLGRKIIIFKHCQYFECVYTLEQRIHSGPY